MKVSREQVAENRERILQQAAKLFREHGIDGIGLADLMRHVGLTHGGFYGYFESKEDLVAQACGRAVGELRQRWMETVEAAEGDPLKALGEAYLARNSNDQVGKGCAFAALGTELARRSPQVRRSITDEFRRLIDYLASVIPGRSKAARRQKALATYASMVGGLVLARAVDDPELSNEILRAVAAPLIGPAKG